MSITSGSLLRYCTLLQIRDLVLCARGPNTEPQRTNPFRAENDRQLKVVGSGVGRCFTKVSEVI